jgi:hypothetical protein
MIFIPIVFLKSFIDVIILFYESLFVFFVLFAWSLCCKSYLEIRLLTTHIDIFKRFFMFWSLFHIHVNKGNNKITELRTILQRESQNS